MIVLLFNVVLLNICMNVYILISFLCWTGYGRFGKISSGLKIVNSTSRDGHCWMECILRMF